MDSTLVTEALSFFQLSLKRGDGRCYRLKVYRRARPLVSSGDAARLKTVSASIRTCNTLTKANIQKGFALLSEKVWAFVFDTLKTWQNGKKEKDRTRTRQITDNGK